MNSARPRQILATLAATGVPPSDGAAAARLSVGTDDALARIEDETFPFVASGGADIQFIYAPYGRGKTHFLRTLGHLSRERGFVTANIDCRDGDSPFASLVETYRAIARAMSPPVEGQYFSGVGIGRVIEARLNGESGAAERLVESVRSATSLPPDYRNLIRSHATVAAGESDELYADLDALLGAVSTRRVAPGRLSRQHPRLPRPLGKLARRNAGFWLRALLTTPLVLGYAGIVVLFDETETVLSRGGPKRIQTRLSHLRTFIDYLAIGAVPGCAIYYATAEDFVETTGQYLGALAQRVERLRVVPPERAPNPRAVWVDLDELTDPGPRDVRFFRAIAERIGDVGREAGMSPDHVQKLIDWAELLAIEYAERIDEGNVREFVKRVAAQAAAPPEGR